MSWIMGINRALSGWPDTALTWLLTGVCIIGLVIAWCGKPGLKAFMLAWFALP